MATYRGRPYGCILSAMSTFLKGFAIVWYSEHRAWFSEAHAFKVPIRILVDRRVWPKEQFRQYLQQYTYTLHGNCKGTNLLALVKVHDELLIVKDLHPGALSQRDLHSSTVAPIWVCMFFPSGATSWIGSLQQVGALVVVGAGVVGRSLSCCCFGSGFTLLWK